MQFLFITCNRFLMFLDVAHCRPFDSITLLAYTQTVNCLVSNFSDAQSSRWKSKSNKRDRSFQNLLSFVYASSIYMLYRKTMLNQTYKCTRDLGTHVNRAYLSSVNCTLCVMRILWWRTLLLYCMSALFLCCVLPHEREYFEGYLIFSTTIQRL